MKRLAIIHRTLDPIKGSEYRTNWLTLQAMIKRLHNHQVFLFVAQIDNLTSRIRDILPDNVEIIGIEYPYVDFRLHHPLTKRWVHRQWQIKVRSKINSSFGKDFFHVILIGSSLNWDNYIDFSSYSRKVIVGPLDGARKIELNLKSFSYDPLRFLKWKLLDLVNRIFFNFSFTFKKVLKNASIVLVNSCEMERLIEKRTTAPIFRIPDTVAGKLKIEKQEKLSFLSEDKVRIIWVGSLIFRKNPQELIELIESFKNESVEFIICGEGKGYYKTRFLKKIEELPNVFYKGLLNSSDLADEFCKSDFVLFTSIRDGYTNVFMEALENLTPSIVTSAMACSEFNNEFLPDLVYKPGKILSISETIKSHLEQKHKVSNPNNLEYANLLDIIHSEYFRFDVNTRAEILMELLLND